MVEFSIFGIRVRVEPFFWVFLALIGGGFQALASNSPEAYLGVALFVLAGFVSILIHELGHALMIKKFGLPTEIVLTTFGGYASYPAGILTRRKSFVVTAAGPLLQLVCGGIVFVALISAPPLGGKLHLFFHYFVVVSIFWAVLNCLPIYPMDGGQMLGAILGPRRAKALYMTGMTTAGIMGMIALAFGSILLMVFMGLFAFQNYQLYQQSRY